MPGRGLGDVCRAVRQHRGRISGGTSYLGGSKGGREYDESLGLTCAEERIPSSMYLYLSIITCPCHGARYNDLLANKGSLLGFDDYISGI